MDEDFNLLFSYIGTILNDIKHRVTRVFPFPDVERGYTKLSSRRIRCKNGKCSKYGISLAKKNLGAQWPHARPSYALVQITFYPNDAGYSNVKRNNLLLSSNGLMYSCWSSESLSSACFLLRE